MESCATGAGSERRAGSRALLETLGLTPTTRNCKPQRHGTCQSWQKCRPHRSLLHCQVRAAQSKVQRLSWHHGSCCQTSPLTAASSEARTCSSTWTRLGNLQAPTLLEGPERSVSNNHLAHCQHCVRGSRPPLRTDWGLLKTTLRGMPLHGTRADLIRPTTLTAVRVELSPRILTARLVRELVQPNGRLCSSCSQSQCNLDALNCAFSLFYE